jgi:mannose-6-phosphate isomerase-like protein (cupin superfamily)
MSVLVIRAGEGELVGDAADRRVEILCDSESLAATWSRFAPGRDGADLHVHHHHTDFFYVLAGELTVRLGMADEPVIVPVGMLARVPPWVVHGFRNAGETELRFVNLHAPGMQFADYLRAMRDGSVFAFDQHAPPEEGGRPVSEVSMTSGEGVLTDGAELGVSEVLVGSGAVAAGRRGGGALYVLEGVLRVEADGGEWAAEAGAWVQVEDGVVYSLTAVGEEPAHLLEIQPRT